MRKLNRKSATPKRLSNSVGRFEWQACYKEVATALIKFSLFGPPLLLRELSKRRLFEHF
ncbi:hypothetical protein MTR_6g074790 [Medicago truncatula]|uniref:Uncharacterized protein n=1 Tax=Medicago truncatula TaxID=3880 RepID=G7KJ67_MEDTR|nr:hypothetical protein MTR_6g074790 [Medicago truncatula]